MKVHQLLEKSTPYGYTNHEPSDDEQAVCDNILGYLTKAHTALMKLDTDSISPDGKQKLSRIYNSWRTDLMHGDLQAWHKSYDEVSGKHVDAFDFFMNEVFAAAGIDEREGTIEDFLAKCGA